MYFTSLNSILSRSMGIRICGCALVFGRGTLYMKWGLILAKHDRETRSSTGVERQRELVNLNLTLFHPLIIINILLFFII